MKTDIAGSTPAFRRLLTTDQQALLRQHSEFIAGLAAENGGQILESAGDGYWLEFPSVTGAAKSAITMQEALRSAQADRGDDRLAIRIVIGLGDIIRLPDVKLGDVVPLIVRVETITPADEIYLTSAANSALAPAEIQTSLMPATAGKLAVCGIVFSMFIPNPLTSPTIEHSIVLICVNSRRITPPGYGSNKITPDSH
jgi:class 3 adenylate cyclase